MNSNGNFYFWLLSTLAFYSSSHVFLALSEENPETSIQSMTEKISDEEITRIMHIVNQCMTGTMHTTKSLIRIVDQRYPQIPERKEAAIPALQAFEEHLDKVITGLWEARPSSQDELLEILVTTLELCRTALSELASLVESDFKQLPNLDLLQTTRGMHLGINVEEFQQRSKLLLAELAMLNIKIEKASDEAGLTISQKIARKVHTYLVDPFFKYKLHIWVPVCATATALAWYAYWTNFCPRSGEVEDITITGLKKPQQQTRGLYGKDAIKAIAMGKTTTKYSWFATKTVQWFGLAPKISPAGLPELDSMDRGRINQGLVAIRTILSHADPIITIPGLFLLNSLKSKFYDMCVGVSQTCTALWNKARGGAYKDLPIDGVFETVPRFTLDDVIGLHKVKECTRSIMEYAINPLQFRNNGQVPCCNLIFFGLTRAGKSFFAECLAGTVIQMSALPFRYIVIPVTALHQYSFDAMVQFVQERAPCIVFIDEFDLAGTSRAKDIHMLHQVLRGLGQGSTLTKDPYKPIILITACNKIEGIDEALRTIGRLGISIPFLYPTLDDRVDFITQFLRKNMHNVEHFDINRLAQKMANRPFEDIEQSLKMASNKCIRTGILTQKLIEESIDETLYALHRRILPYELHMEMIRLLSVHFAGRALALLLSDGISTLDVVSINSYNVKVYEDYYESFTGKQSENKKVDFGIVLARSLSDENNDFMPPAALDAQIMELVAGAVAEEIIYGTCTNTCHKESTAQAFDRALNIESNGLWRTQLKMLSTEQRTVISNAATARFERCKKLVRDLLEEHKEALITTSHALSILGTLDDRMVGTIIQEPKKAMMVLSATSRIMQQVENQEERFLILEQLDVILSSTELLNAYVKELEEHMQKNQNQTTTPEKGDTVTQSPAIA
jgi:AAA+ superfamily predicted ATPase